MRIADQIERIIQENLHNVSFGVEMLADLLHISPSFLRELTHEHFAFSPHRLIEKRRIDRAILLWPQYPYLHQLARAVGFQSVRTFRRAFRIHMGMTPSEYQKRRLCCDYKTAAL